MHVVKYDSDDGTDTEHESNGDGSSDDDSADVIGMLAVAPSTIHLSLSVVSSA